MSNTGFTFSKDLNTELSDGIKIVSYNSDTSNRPTEYGVCLNISHYTENVYNQWSNQLAFSTVGTIYYRYKIGTDIKWSDWRQI